MRQRKEIGWQLVTGAKKGFVVFSTWEILEHVYILQNDHQKGRKINIKKRKEVPEGSNSLKARVGGRYFTSGVLAFDRRSKLIRGNSVRCAQIQVI